MLRSKYSLVNAIPVLICLRRVEVGCVNDAPEATTFFLHLFVSDVSTTANFHTFQKHGNRNKINEIPYNLKSVKPSMYL